MCAPRRASRESRSLHRRWLLVPLAFVSVLACREGGERTAGQSADPSRARHDALLLASAKVALPPEGFSSAQLPEAGSDGATLLVEHCTACHALPNPLTHSAADWRQVARRMWLRIEGLSPDLGVPVPSPAERIVLLRYLAAHALRVSSSALPPGPNRALFVATCGRCHELPDPRTYAPEDWVAVVERMRTRMEAVFAEVLPAETAAGIVQYLVETSHAVR